MSDYTRVLLKDFICVRSVLENGAILNYYGGDQSWFETQNGRAGGCGTVAAANILSYFGVVLGTERLPLNSDSPEKPKAQCFSREVFTRHMHEVYRGLTPMKAPWQSLSRGGSHRKRQWSVLRLPDSLGIHSPVRFSRAVVTLAHHQGTRLRTVWPEKTRGRRPANHALSLQEAKTFILQQVDKGYPVAMLNFGNKELRGIDYQSPVTGRKYTTDRFQWHWVVITGVEPLKRDEVVADVEPFYLVVSSWGSRVVLDLNRFWGRGLTHLVSFEIQS